MKFPKVAWSAATTGAGTLKLKVAIAEDNVLVREALVQLLAGQADIAVVSACADLPSLLAAVDDDAPHVVVTDVRMPPTGVDEGLSIAERLRTTHPSTGVVVLSQSSEPAYALALLRSGSNRRAYMLKHRVHNRAELLSAVRTVAQGGSWIDPEVVGMLVARHAEAKHSIIRELSAPEVELLALIGNGASNAAIAEGLALTQQTAERRIDSLLMKLGLGDAEAGGHRVKATLLLLADSTVPPAR